MERVLFEQKINTFFSQLTTNVLILAFSFCRFSYRRKVYDVIRFYFINTKQPILFFQQIQKVLKCKNMTFLFKLLYRINFYSSKKSILYFFNFCNIWVVIFFFFFT